MFLFFSAINLRNSFDKGGIPLALSCDLEYNSVQKY